MKKFAPKAENEGFKTIDTNRPPETKCSDAERKNVASSSMDSAKAAICLAASEVAHRRGGVTAPGVLRIEGRVLGGPICDGEY